MLDTTKIRGENYLCMDTCAYKVIRELCDELDRLHEHYEHLSKFNGQAQKACIIAKAQVSQLMDEVVRKEEQVQVLLNALVAKGEKR